MKTAPGSMDSPSMSERRRGNWRGECGIRVEKIAVNMAATPRIELLAEQLDVVARDVAVVVVGGPHRGPADRAAQDVLGQRAAVGVGVGIQAFGQGIDPRGPQAGGGRRGGLRRCGGRGRRRTRRGDPGLLAKRRTVGRGRGRLDLGGSRTGLGRLALRVMGAAVGVDPLVDRGRSGGRRQAGRGHRGRRWHRCRRLRQRRAGHGRQGHAERRRRDSHGSCYPCQLCRCCNSCDRRGLFVPTDASFRTIRPHGRARMNSHAALPEESWFL